VILKDLERKIHNLASIVLAHIPLSEYNLNSLKIIDCQRLLSFLGNREYQYRQQPMVLVLEYLNCRYTDFLNRSFFFLYNIIIETSPVLSSIQSAASFAHLSISRKCEPVRDFL